MAQPTGAMDSLVSAFASVLRGGVEAACALERFAEAAVSINRYLVRRGARDDPRLKALTTPPTTLAVSAVEEWIKGWSQVLGDKALRVLVLSEADWLSPFFRARGTELDGMREHRFDVSHLGKAELELCSSAAFERARWRFGETGERHTFDEPYRAPDGNWRTTLPAPTEKTLVVRTKSEKLRLRAIMNPGAAR